MNPKLLAALESQQPVTIDLDSGEWQRGSGPIVDAPERREPPPRMTPMQRTLKAMWEWW